MHQRPRERPDVCQPKESQFLPFPDHNGLSLSDNPGGVTTQVARNCISHNFPLVSTYFPLSPVSTNFPDNDDDNSPRLKSQRDMRRQLASWFNPNLKQTLIDPRRRPGLAISFVVMRFQTTKGILLR